jgi:leader peptidase (prepilin peptidase)/N-methyltransferase
VRPAEALASAVAGFAGLIFGSFANVLIYRLPRSLSVITPRSFCPACRTTIGALDNIPVLSYLVLRGRCRSCGVKIPASYPLVEIAMGSAWAAAVALVRPAAGVPAALVLLFTLVVATATDLKTMRIPNKLQIGAAVAGVPCLVGGSIYTGQYGRLAVAAICGAGMLAGLFLLALLVRGGIGMGDVKLLALCSLYLGWFSWKLIPAMLFLSIVVGGAVSVALVASGKKRLKDRIPFGPFIAAGAAAILLASHPLFPDAVSRPPF